MLNSSNSNLYLLCSLRFLFIGGAYIFKAANKNFETA